MDTRRSFEEMAWYLEKIYGVEYNREEKFVICPECGNPLYKSDYTQEEFNTEYGIACPICEIDF